MIPATPTKAFFNKTIEMTKHINHALYDLLYKIILNRSKLRRTKCEKALTKFKMEFKQQNKLLSAGRIKGLIPFPFKMGKIYNHFKTCPWCLVCFVLFSLC